MDISEEERDIMLRDIVHWCFDTPNSAELLYFCESRCPFRINKMYCAVGAELSSKEDPTMNEELVRLSKAATKKYLEEYYEKIFQLTLDSKDKE